MEMDANPDWLLLLPEVLLMEIQIKRPNPAASEGTIRKWKRKEKPVIPKEEFIVAKNQISTTTQLIPAFIQTIERILVIFTNYEIRRGVRG